jgi:hypothetical protein
LIALVGNLLIDVMIKIGRRKGGKEEGREGGVDEDGERTMRKSEGRDHKSISTSSRVIYDRDHSFPHSPVPEHYRGTRSQ